MNPVKASLLWASQNQQLRRHVPNLPFVKRAVQKFMPGEDVESALAAAAEHAERGLPTTLTHLGEAVTNSEEAGQAAQHYVDLLDRIKSVGLDTEISVKATQLGLVVDPELARQHLHKLAAHADTLSNWVWVDIEQSEHVDGTLDLYRSVRTEYANVGLCLQSYLYRTAQDIVDLLPLRPGIRLVKGAYKEPKEIAFTSKRDNDRMFHELAVRLLREVPNGVRLILGTHDVDLMARIDSDPAAPSSVKEDYEIQMLYGIRIADQLRYVAEGRTIRTLISYGTAWYPWYVRRLAERPTNLGFVVRNLVPAKS